MSDQDKSGPNGVSRRGFLAGSSAVAAAGAIGLPGAAQAAAHAKPKRGGTLRYSSRVDGRGLDPHRNFVYYVSNPMALTTMGLVDLDKDMAMAPGVASEWESNKELTKWTFRLRQGAEYHNGRTIDAESVKWNIERIMDPAIGHPFTRSATTNIAGMETDGKWIIHFTMKKPDAIFPSNMIYYPVNLIAPDSAEQADQHPIGCGAFKFKSWKRYAKTELERFENYFETGADGKPLPYLDGVVAYPKREDTVRLTALRSGEVDMIENMSYFDVTDFKKDYADQFNTWSSPQVGLAHLNINAKEGSPFADSSPNGRDLRLAVAHAIDKEGIHQAVFNELGEKMSQFYVSSSGWHNEGVDPGPEYDPEKSRFILRKHNMENMPINVVARSSYQYMRNGGEIAHAMLLEAGFGATNEVYDNPALTAKYKDPKDDWGIDSTASSFRFDPDGWFSRWVHSEAPDNQRRVGFKNAECDKLIEEARATTDVPLRKELYARVDSIMNGEAALLYHHSVPLTGAAVKNLKGYEPQLTGGPNYQNGGVRTAYFDPAS